MTKKQIFSEAIDLPPIQRAQLIEDLLDSFSVQHREEIDEIWAKEAEERMKAFDAGKIKAISSEKIFNKINKWK